jgi:2-polyprenyl-3-methyl-5-hydroxy-6-metoxy-1,4-benzoquinol methylase
MSLDDVLDDLLSRPQSPGGTLTDTMIDHAAAELFKRVQSLADCVVELPHHDYVALASRHSVEFSSFDAVVIITADFETLVARNAARAGPVPTAYIARCFGSTKAFGALLEHQRDSHWVELDSGRMRPDQMEELARILMRPRDADHPSRLVELPDRRRPYMGGHYVADTEWDDDLVNHLVDRFDIKSVLDLGCGLGLTLDRFASKGVKCWGVEGNANVIDGPCKAKERLYVVDFTKQAVVFPNRFDLVWCVEVLEHVPREYEANVIRSIVANVGRIAFVSAAEPGQPGYGHINCQPRANWIEKFALQGLRYVARTNSILSSLTDVGPFGPNFLKRNGMILERDSL